MDAILRHIELKPAAGEQEGAASYPLSIPAIANLGTLEFNEGVTFLVGENGSGKSTLLEAIAIKAGFNPEGGTKNFTGTHRPSESDLSGSLRLVRGVRRERSGFFLRAETMFNVATEAEGHTDAGWAVLHEMSHGEAFLWVAMNRFFDGGLYLLDEPEAALSPQRQLALLVRIHQLASKGSQFVISTHSPILMASPGATLYHLDSEGIREVAFEDTEHYRITRDFLENPERMLHHLLSDDA